MMTWLQLTITSSWHTTPMMIFNFLQTQYDEKLVSAGSSHVYKDDITSLFTIRYPRGQSVFHLSTWPSQLSHFICPHSFTKQRSTVVICPDVLCFHDFFFSVSRTCVQNICLIRYPHVLEHLCHIPSGIWRIPKEIGTPASKSVTDTHTRVHM
jgi:hypothetical protein